MSCMFILCTYTLFTWCSGSEGKEEILIYSWMKKHLQCSRWINSPAKNNALNFSFPCLYSAVQLASVWPYDALNPSLGKGKKDLLNKLETKSHVAKKFLSMVQPSNMSKWDISLACFPGDTRQLCGLTRHLPEKLPKWPIGYTSFKVGGVCNLNLFSRDWSTMKWYCAGVDNW